MHESVLFHYLPAKYVARTSCGEYGSQCNWFDKEIDDNEGACACQKSD